MRAALGAVAGPDPPAWEYLLSHHLPDRYRRTLRVRVGGRLVHLCARCTGQVLGLTAWFVVFVTVRPASVALFAWPAEVVCAVLPAAAAGDWLLQSLDRRESTNGRRLVTGAMLGAALANLLALAVTGRIELFLVGLGVLAGYVVTLAAILRWTGAWRSVLEQHFPGIDLGPVS